MGEGEGGGEGEEGGGERGRSKKCGLMCTAVADMYHVHCMCCATTSLFCCPA